MLPDPMIVTDGQEPRQSSVTALAELRAAW